MRYTYVAQDGTLCETGNHKLACLAALHGTYGATIPDNGKAGLIIRLPDGRRYWQVVTARAIS